MYYWTHIRAFSPLGDILHSIYLTQHWPQGAWGMPFPVFLEWIKNSRGDRCVH